jgi:hypothetical protein
MRNRRRKPAGVNGGLSGLGQFDNAQYRPDPPWLPAEFHGPGFRPRETDHPHWIATFLARGDRLTHRQELIQRAHPEYVATLVWAILGCDP